MGAGAVALLVGVLGCQGPAARAVRPPPITAAAATSGPDDRARYWMLVGWYALDQGDREGARSAFARAAELDPSATAPRDALASLSREPAP